jgi:hypothetical protein
MYVDWKWLSLWGVISLVGLVVEAVKHSWWFAALYGTSAACLFLVAWTDYHRSHGKGAS